MERLVDKSDRQLFINDLNTGFGLSKVEAEALYDRITIFNRDYCDGSRGLYQITKTVVALGEPAGKPIKYCRMVSVNLTMWGSDPRGSRIPSWDKPEHDKERRCLFQDARNRIAYTRHG